MLQKNDSLHSWGLFKREALEKHNFAKSLTSGVDWQLWIDLIKDGYQGAIVEEELYLKRWHNESITLTDKKSHEEVREKVLVASNSVYNMKLNFVVQDGKFSYKRYIGVMTATARFGKDTRQFLNAVKMRYPRGQIYWFEGAAVAGRKTAWRRNWPGY